MALSASQQSIADIAVRTVQADIVEYTVYAPGEVLSNGYTSYVVSPRVPSVVVQRHVALGDHVSEGRDLVTLFSAEVAESQNDYLTASSQWSRVQELGEKAVGQERYLNAKTHFIQSRATLINYGISEADIAKIPQLKASEFGYYTLTASTDGVILADSFAQGERVEAGRALLSVADENTLWVEAFLPPDDNPEVELNDSAIIKVGDKSLFAQVAQQAHTIDHVTRTRKLRLTVQNKRHQLHPGLFADVFFLLKTETPIIALPEEALIRKPDGQWIAYVQNEEGEFAEKSVTLGRQLGDLHEIKGLKNGDSVVVSGAFFIASQQAKAGFDPHNH
ncbi:efflux RND transporter periplasmic adaptor subunit [Sessilibacter sp. MAH1]